MDKLNREQNLQSDKEKGFSKKQDKQLLADPYCCIVWRETEYDDRIEREILTDVVVEGDDRPSAKEKCREWYERDSGDYTKWEFDNCALADDIRLNPTVYK